MRDNTFTPGPWVKNGLFVDGADGSAIFTGLGYEANNTPSGYDVCEANARLIAAAPDMYDALWEVCELSDRNLTEAGRTPECQRVYDLCRAALSKAEGE